jgi:hypothetical protein
VPKPTWSMRAEVNNLPREMVRPPLQKSSAIPQRCPGYTLTWLWRATASQEQFNFHGNLVVGLVARMAAAQGIVTETRVDNDLWKLRTMPRIIVNKKASGTMSDRRGRARNQSKKQTSGEHDPSLACNGSPWPSQRQPTIPTSYNKNTCD